MIKINNILKIFFVSIFFMSFFNVSNVYANNIPLVKSVNLAPKHKKPFAVLAKVPNAKYKGLKSLKYVYKKPSHYLKIENLHNVMRYILSHYPHGKYPLLVKSNGEILYPYNIINPVVFIRIRRLSLIKFPNGTKINSVALGNSLDFTVAKVSNDNGDYLIVKPTHPYLRTSLVVTTSKRIYYFTLISTMHRFVPIVGFYYPGLFIKRYKNTVKTVHSEIAFPKKHFAFKDLNFDYFTTGHGYKISRIFNNGKETFIKIGNLHGIPHPAIFVRINHKNYLVNFLYKNGYYILRNVPKTIILISRTKSTKREVKIYYKHKPNYIWW